MSKLIDTFPFNDELELLDLRLNYLNDVVDEFIIVEGNYSHQGKKKDLYFEKNKSLFKKYLSKINHVVVDDFPLLNGKPIQDHFTYDYYTRDCILKGFKKKNGTHDKDIVMISDVDEFPNKEKIKCLNNKITIFKHLMLYFKFNLRCTGFEQDDGDGLWPGTRIVFYKNLSTPQGIRNIKPKHYPFWRFDKPKIFFIEGGWHFRYLGSAETLLKEFKNRAIGYSERKLESLTIQDIKDIIINKKPLLGGEKYEELPKDQLPRVFIENFEKYKKFFL